MFLESSNAEENDDEIDENEITAFLEADSEDEEKGDTCNDGDEDDTHDSSKETIKDNKEDDVDEEEISAFLNAASDDSDSDNEKQDDDQDGDDDDEKESDTEKMQTDEGTKESENVQSLQGMVKISDNMMNDQEIKMICFEKIKVFNVIV